MTDYPGLPSGDELAARAAALYSGRIIDGVFTVTDHQPGLRGGEKDQEKIDRALRRSMRPDFVERGKTWYSRLGRRVARFAWRLARRMIRRLWVRKRVLAPVLIGTAAWCVAAILWLMKSGFLVPPLFGIGLAPWMYWWCGGRLGRFTRDRGKLKALYQRRWYTAAYMTLFLLSTLSAAWTPAPPAAGLWMIGAGVFQTRWWWHHRIREDKTPDLDPRLRRLLHCRPLRGNVVVPGPIQELTGPDREVVDLDLSLGDLVVSDLASPAAAKHLAKAFTRPRANIIVDDVVAGTDIAARLTVLHTNLLHSVVEWDESWKPDASDPVGTFRYHRYGDGQIGRLRLWTPGSGTKNSLFSGDIGTGKSAGMLLAAIQALWTGQVHPLVGDPQGGQSLTTLAGAGGIVELKATDAEQVYHQLAALYAAMEERSKYLQGYIWYDKHHDRQIGMPFFDPFVMQSQEYNPLNWPILLYLLDEAHMACKDPVFGTLICDLLEMIIKLSRKTGIAVWAATQYPGIEELGGRMPIRQNLINGNIIACRNSTQVAGTMMLPSSFPSPFDIDKETPDGEETMGYAIISSAAPKSSRPVQSRIGFIERATKVTQEAAPMIKPMDEITGNAFAAHNVTLQDLELAAEVAAMAELQEIGDRENGGERERIVVTTKPAEKPEPKRPGRRPETLRLAVEYLQSQVAKGEYPAATSGVIAAALGMEERLSTVSMALKRGGKQGIVHEYQGQDGLWALGPAPEMAEAAA